MQTEVAGRVAQQARLRPVRSHDHQERTAKTSAPDAELGPSTLSPVARPTGAYVRVVKPVFDRLAGLVIMLVALPVMIACALAVRISLGRHVLFTQERIGLDGKTFTVYKFRTMLADRRQGERERAPSMSYVGTDRRKTHKHPRDPRVTGVGGFLRKWSLDELPQLINVVKGDMSLVGPRPELPFIADRYSDHQRSRHYVRPGLTGLWQILERGQEAPMHNFIDVDLDYVRRVSPRLDAMILLRTPLAVVGVRKGF